DYNYGYQTVSFEQGWRHFTGEQALQFARSRHGNHGENSDFARSARQQIIINAVREDLLSAGTLLNPTKILSIFTSLGDHVRTNAEIWELAHLGALARDIPSENMVSRVIDQGEGGFLTSEIVPETGAYVLLPKVGLGDFSEIQQMASTVFDQPELVKEEPTVVIQNGSKVTGLGARTAEVLRNSHFDVTTIANAEVRDNATTLIFDLSAGEKPVALDELASLLHVGTQHIKTVTETALDPAVVNTKEVPPGTDFIVVLGLDYSVAEKANE
ncbi:MAG: LCP family protein, partial [Patescibacteria group bacterium]